LKGDTFATRYAVTGRDLIGRQEGLRTWVEGRKSDDRWSFGRTVLRRDGIQVSVQSENGKITSGVNFGSQDYLGLCDHPLILARAQEALATWGPHSAGSEPNLGNSILTKALRADLADYLQREFVVLFPTGWMAAYGVIAGLMRLQDHVILDRFAHNCLVAGARAASDDVQFFSHNSMESLRETLATIREEDTENAILVVTESVFSMDSDGPAMNELVELVHSFDGFVLVDVAHDLGALGLRGLGRLGESDCLRKVDFIMGTFSKTFCSNGGFFATSSQAVELATRCFGGTNAFSNALAPLQCAIVSAALQIVRSDEGEQLRRVLQETVGRLRKSLEAEGLVLFGQTTAIVPVFTGDESIGRDACERAAELGVITNFVEYPGVSLGQSRLRLQLSPAHATIDFDGCAHRVSQAIRESRSAFRSEV
jgi:glycine C-acetyltransferase